MNTTEIIKTLEANHSAMNRDESVYSAAADAIRSLQSQVEWADGPHGLMVQKGRLRLRWSDTNKAWQIEWRGECNYVVAFLEFGKDLDEGADLRTVGMRPWELEVSPVVFFRFAKTAMELVQEHLQESDAF